MDTIKVMHVLIVIILAIKLVDSQTTQTINVRKYLFIYVLHLLRDIYLFVLLGTVYVNEEGNLVAEKAVEVALEYVKRNINVGIKVEIERVVGNRTDAKGTLDSCKSISCCLP